MHRCHTSGKQAYPLLGCTRCKCRRVQSSSKPQTKQRDPAGLCNESVYTGPQVHGIGASNAPFHPLDLSTGQVSLVKGTVGLVADVRRFEDLKFHQQITQATTMALDLGLAQKPRSMTNRSIAAVTTSESNSPDDGPNEHRETSQSVMSPEKRLPDSSSIESRRTLLACYVFCTR